MKKSLFYFALLFCIAFHTIFAQPDGLGTSASPWIIDENQDLIDIMSNNSYWNGYIELRTNLNLSGISVSPIGLSISNYFNGNFNGNGHTISNITINNSSSDYQGLFGCIYLDGVVSNLIIENASITGYDYTGILAGETWGTIDNCHTSGAVIGNERVGGFCGGNGRNITNSYSNASVSGATELGGFCGRNYGNIRYCYSTGSVTGGTNAGGFVGFNYQGVYNCYSTGNVEGHSSIGGFCGSNDHHTIVNCYSTGNATANYYTGGFCGFNFFGTINHCFSIGMPISPNNVGGFIGDNFQGYLECNYWGCVNANYFDVGDMIYSNPRDLPDDQIKELTITQFSDFTNFPCFDPSLWGIPSNSEHPVFIPTLSEWATILFASAMVIIGAFYIWKN